MMVNAAYFICLQYGSEIFPTVIRGQGVALCEIVGGFAIFLSPTVVYLVKSFIHYHVRPLYIVPSPGQSVLHPPVVDIRPVFNYWSSRYIFPA